jgi:hypothetical protein
MAMGKRIGLASRWATPKEIAVAAAVCAKEFPHQPEFRFGSKSESQSEFQSASCK